MVESQLRLSSGSTPAGSWEMRDAVVHPDLSNAVNRLCGFAENATVPIRRIELPGPSCVLIISFGSPYRLESPTDPWTVSIPPFGFVGGLGEHATVDIADGTARCIQIDLSPIGLYRLFGIPMSQLANRVVAIEDVFGASAVRLAEKLECALDWSARLEIVERELRSRFDEGPVADPRVEWAWSELMRSGGSVDIGLLADKLEISRKHLIDRFRDQIGLPPKRAARLIRFNRVAELARKTDIHDWADLAQRAGYFDQAHFINEVRRFSGRAPTDLFSRTVPT